MEYKSPPSSTKGSQDHATPKVVPMPSPVQPELSTLWQVRREMAALYHAAKRGEISSRELKDSIYALSQIAKLIEISKLEARLETLERMATAGERAH